MRFCFLTTFYPPYNFGGDGINVQRLARGLARRGHHVTVVHDVDAYLSLSEGPPRPGFEKEPEGIEVIPLKSGLGVLSPLLTQQTGRPVVNGRRIAQILSANRFDVIHFHNVSLVGGPGLFHHGSAVKLYTAHEHWLICPTHVLWRHRREICTSRECLKCQLIYRRPPQWWRGTGLLEREIRSIDAFIALSEFSRQKHREFGFPREMEVLPGFLPDQESGEEVVDGSPHARPYFFFAGRLEEIKGLDDVIPAFRDYTGADLLIAGEGRHGPVLRRLAAGIDRVKFLGWIGPDALRRYYRHAVAALVPSVCFETFGITVIEAFQQSTPVIGRDLGALPEIVAAAGGGELFTTREELAAAMSRLQGDPEHRRRLGDSARQAFVDRWSESAVLPKYLDLVRRAGERRAGGPSGAPAAKLHEEVT
jgi:glycosyltransferase involved in cell wall biosynthesis